MKNLILWIITGIIFSLGISYCFAHDPGRPALNEWFDGLRSEMGACCSNSDGKVIKDSDWDSKDGHYRVFLEGNWIDVPDGAVIKEPNLDGQTIVWPMTQSIFGGPAKTAIRCFLPGSMT